MNTTIISLRLTNLFSAPMFMKMNRLDLSKSKFSRFWNPIVYNSPARIDKTEFSHGISSAIKLSGITYKYYGNIYNESMGFGGQSINISSCTFSDIKGQTAIEFYEGDLIINYTQFISCSANENYPAILFLYESTLSLSSVCINNVASGLSTILASGSKIECNLLNIVDSNTSIATVATDLHFTKMSQNNISKSIVSQGSIYYILQTSENSGSLRLDNSLIFNCSSDNMLSLKTYLDVNTLIEYLIFNSNSILSSAIVANYSFGIDHSYFTNNIYSEAVDLFQILRDDKKLQFTYCFFDFASFNLSSIIFTECEFKYTGKLAELEFFNTLNCYGNSVVPDIIPELFGVQKDEIAGLVIGCFAVIVALGQLCNACFCSNTKNVERDEDDDEDEKEVNDRL